MYSQIVYHNCRISHGDLTFDRRKHVTLSFTGSHIWWQTENCVGKPRLKYNQTFGTLHARARRAERLKACSLARSFSLLYIFISTCMYPLVISTQCRTLCLCVCILITAHSQQQPDETLDLR